MTQLLAFLAALVMVLLQAYCQIILKWQVGVILKGPLTLAALPVFLFQALTNVWIISGLAAAFAGMLFWLVALTRLELNQAYPFVALTIPTVAILGTIVFQEGFPLLRVVGLALVTVGVLFVAAS